MKGTDRKRSTDVQEHNKNDNKYSNVTENTLKLINIECRQGKIFFNKCKIIAL